jgi:prepilin-type N-terminal cleavage/methylation domain-containing protein
VTIRRTARGFTLVEVAVAALIIGLLLSSLMYTFAAQVDRRNFEETRARLDRARELVLAFAVANGRLPCPARSTSAGAEAWDSATGKCTSGGVDDYYGGSLSGGATGGLLPASTIGFREVDSSGFAVDAWQNRIRYAVAKSRATGTCGITPPAGTIIFTHAGNLKTYGMSCQPDDLLICKTTVVTPTISATSCGGSPAGANQIMNQSLVVAIVFSTGKNATSTGGSGADEAANLDGAGTTDPVFVYHEPRPSSGTGGEFDDQMTWITIGDLVGKLVTAGVLP